MLTRQRFTLMAAINHRGFVLESNGAVVDACKLPLNTTAAELKVLVSKTTGQPISNFSLVLEGRSMDGALSLAAHGIETQAEVMMLIDSHDLETDKAALIMLYNSTNGAKWRNKSGWLTDAPVGEWHGVTVDGGRVVSIVLGSNNLNLRGRQLKSV